jgi:pimeloyl-ACP methyl ester carboxylesterase
MDAMTNIVEVDGAKVSYRVDGAGPGLVLLHGTGGNSETSWGQLVGRLSESRIVVRPDYSRSGDTVDDGRQLTVAMLAAQVVAAAKRAGATPFDLVGYSLGAAVAIYISPPRSLTRFFVRAYGRRGPASANAVGPLVRPYRYRSQGDGSYIAVDRFQPGLPRSDERDRCPSSNQANR